MLVWLSVPSLVGVVEFVVLREIVTVELFDVDGERSVSEGETVSDRDRELCHERL